MPDDNILLKFIELRTLVGFLGEKDQAGWWDTSFLGHTGLRYLEIVFPRSTFSAAVNSVGEAARKTHDERIGTAHVYHLFRLPITIEERLHQSLLKLDASDLRKEIANREEALSGLRRLFQEPIFAPHGPVRVGTEKTLLWKTSVEEMARHYFDAFQAGKQTFPYFTADRG